MLLTMRQFPSSDLSSKLAREEWPPSIAIITEAKKKGLFKYFISEVQFDRRPVYCGEAKKK
jgi:hypothetical protein